MCTYQEVSLHVHVHTHIHQGTADKDQAHREKTCPEVKLAGF